MVVGGGVGVWGGGGVVFFFFFFQAEDGIRDIGVTGVQTCALPISHSDKKRIPINSDIFFHYVLPVVPREWVEVWNQHIRHKGPKGVHFGQLKEIIRRIKIFCILNLKCSSS